MDIPIDSEWEAWRDNNSRELQRLAGIADEARAIQDGLRPISNERLIMLALAELIGFMPKSDGSAGTRQALTRELFRRATEQ